MAEVLARLDFLQDAVQRLSAGGLVMLPLAAVSLVLWFLVVFKLLELRALCRGERPLPDCRQHNNGAAWQRELLDAFKRPDAPAPCRLLDGLRLDIQHRAERFVPTIQILTAVAPLLGLLGTVTGMITTFDAIALHGTGNVRAMATGISTALITTQTGLVVALPGLVLGHVIRRRADATMSRMDSFCLELQREAARPITRALP